MLLPERQNQWHSILQMSDALQLLFDKEEWQAMTELNMQRQQKMDTFFSVKVSDDEAMVIASGIQDMLKSDARIAELGQQQKNAMFDNLKRVSTGRQAIKAYANHQK